MSDVATDALSRMKAHGDRQLSRIFFNGEDHCTLLEVIHANLGFSINCNLRIKVRDLHPHRYSGGLAYGCLYLYRYSEEVQKKKRHARLNIHVTLQILHVQYAEVPKAEALKGTAHAAAEMLGSRGQSLAKVSCSAKPKER